MKHNLTGKGVIKYSPLIATKAHKKKKPIAKSWPLSGFAMQNPAGQCMMGFKAFHSAAATLAGIEIAHMIRKGQFTENGLSAFKQFAELAG